MKRRAVLWACIGWVVAVGAPAAYAGAVPEGLQLVAVHSGACLAGPDKPAAVDCGRAPIIELVSVPQHPERVMIRDAAHDTCLYSNRDGRFAWYRCEARFEDQHWIFEAPRGRRLPTEASRGKMVRAVHSGRCLMSNRDGRFGLSACTARYGDHYWALRTRTAGRSQQAIADADWDALVSTLRATSSEISKRNMLAAAARSNYFTAQQLMQALDLFRSEVTLLQVARAMVPRVLDPNHALGYGARMRSSVNRERLVKLLTDAAAKPARPAPPARPATPPPTKAPLKPPAQRCPRQPACGIACPSGNYAHDEHGCSLCACGPDLRP